MKSVRWKRLVMPLGLDIDGPRMRFPAASISAKRRFQSYGMLISEQHIAE